MKDIYNQALINAKQIILKSSDNELSSDQFKEKVFNATKIGIPKLNLEQTNVEIKKEEISYRNAPPGIQFSMSGTTTIECAIYSIPITGNSGLFGSLIQHNIDRQKTFIDHNKLCYKEYSNNLITGNEKLIGEIKNRVVSFTGTINILLEQFKVEVDNFQETKLIPTIDALIMSEINNRNLKSDSEAKLNPFT